MAATWLLIYVLLPYYAVLNIFTCWKWLLDKRSAEYGTWRTSEFALLMMSLLGGWLGAFLAMCLFRHKTQKCCFQFLHLIVTILNVLIFTVILVFVVIR